MALEKYTGDKYVELVGKLVNKIHAENADEYKKGLFPNSQVIDDEVALIKNLISHGSFNILNEEQKEYLKGLYIKQLCNRLGEDIDQTNIYRLLNRPNNIQELLLKLLFIVNVEPEGNENKFIDELLTDQWDAGNLWNLYNQYNFIKSFLTDEEKQWIEEYIAIAIVIKGIDEATLNDIGTGLTTYGLFKLKDTDEYTHGRFFFKYFMTKFLLLYKNKHKHPQPKELLKEIKNEQDLNNLRDELVDETVREIKEHREAAVVEYEMGQQEWEEQREKERREDQALNDHYKAFYAKQAENKAAQEALQKERNAFKYYKGYRKFDNLYREALIDLNYLYDLLVELKKYPPQDLRTGDRDFQPLKDEYEKFGLNEKINIEENPNRIESSTLELLYERFGLGEGEPEARVQKAVKFLGFDSTYYAGNEFDKVEGLDIDEDQKYTGRELIYKIFFRLGLAKEEDEELGGGARKSKKQKKSKKRKSNNSKKRKSNNSKKKSKK